MGKNWIKPTNNSDAISTIDHLTHLMYLTLTNPCNICSTGRSKAVVMMSYDFYGLW